MAQPPQLPRFGASACVWKEGRVLLIQRAQPPRGHWSLPGGHVIFGEPALAAARRELAEETGVVAELVEFAGMYEIIGAAPHIHYIIACYCGFWTSGEPVAASDAMSAKWLAPDEMAGLDFVPHVRSAMDRSRQLLKF